MGDNFSKELQLAKNLQKQCDDNGKEIDPIRSADTLHEFGLLYKAKSPHKISLIQSSAFFNAAIVRQPSNKQFLKSLQDLCSHVLQVAGAEKMQVDLIEISNTVNKKIKEMRVNTSQKLESVKVIPSTLTKECKRKMEEKHINQIRGLQIEISGAYTSIMDYIANECVKIMGKPPCKYSITGMGSLARKEITPYSDFEHIIVLEEGVQNDKHYENILEYFRWFTVIFQLVIINLKETIIRSVAVQWLNDDSITGGDWFFDAPTTCGIKFDGMQLPACKFPLGRPWETDNKPFTVELIKPVSEMLKYLYREEDVKNGYHLADVLSKTCFVSGCKDVHEDYQEKVRETLMKKSALNNIQLVSSIRYEMTHDWKGFDPYNVSSVLFTSSNCNIKSSLYRSITLLVSSLGRLHSIEEFSCFDIVNVLQKRDLINPEAAHQLMYALSVSCAIRLNVYMAKKGQDDFVGGRDFDYKDFKTIKELLFYIGEESLIDYFVIVRSLWSEMLKNGRFCLKNFKCSLRFRFAILFVFQFHDRLLTEGEAYCESNSLETKEDDRFIRVLLSFVLKSLGNPSKAIKLYDTLVNEQNAEADPRFKASIIVDKVDCLANIKTTNDLAYHIHEAKSKILELSLPRNFKIDHLAHLTWLEGNYKFELKQYEEAIPLLEESLMYYNETFQRERESNMIRCLMQIALCLTLLDKPEKAIICYGDIVTLFDNSKTQPPFSILATAYKGFQVCYKKLNQLEKATEYEEKASDLEKRYK